MKDGSTDVKSQGVVVGKAVFPIFDTTAEAAEHLGEAKALQMINAQVKTTKANELRAELTGKPSKAAQTLAAFTRIASSDAAAITEHAGDKAWLENRIQQEIALMDKERLAALGAPTAPDAGSSDDEDSFENDDE
jgi:hypothetical protein